LLFWLDQAAHAGLIWKRWPTVSKQSGGNASITSE